MNYLIIALVALTIILLYILYVYYRSSSSIVSNVVNLNGSNIPVVISDNPSSYQYTYGVWVYVNSWSNNSNKPIFTVPNQINVYLDKTSPTLYVDINQNCSATSGQAAGSRTPPMAVTDNFPMQRWTYVSIVVDNFFVDMYLDGKMMKSMKMNCMQYMPSAKNASVYLGGSPTVVSDIKVTKMYRWSYVLAPQDVWKNYMSGNGVSSSFATYGANLDIMKNSTVQNTIKLF